MPKAEKHVPHLRLRVEPRLLQRLEKARERHGKTLTGEIVDRLEASFRRDEERETWKEVTANLNRVTASLQGVAARVQASIEQDAPKRAALENVLAKIAGVDPNTANELRELISHFAPDPEIESDKIRRGKR
jgi:hypothetical protein